jgi:hypothetical protein
MSAPVLIPLPSRKTSAGEPEVTKFIPRPGRTPPARLQVVSEPTEERTVCARDSGRLTWKDILALRGELPAPSPKAPRAARTKKPAPFVPPYLREGYRWDLVGSDLHTHMQREAGKGASIRATPRNLSALLKTAEWKGAKVAGTVPSPHLGTFERAFQAATKRVEEAREEVLKLDARIVAATTPEVRETLEASRRSVRKDLEQRTKSADEAGKQLDIVRAEEWIRVVHPSGAEVQLRPQWGE